MNMKTVANIRPAPNVAETQWKVTLVQFTISLNKYLKLKIDVKIVHYVKIT